MSNGALLGVLLVAGLLAWIAVDVFAWLAGYETLSQYITKRAKKDRWYGWLIYLITIGGAIWLVMHWELPEILTQ